MSFQLPTPLMRATFQALTRVTSWVSRPLICSRWLSWPVVSADITVSLSVNSYTGKTQVWKAEVTHTGNEQCLRLSIHIRPLLFCCIYNYKHTSLHIDAKMSNWLYFKGNEITHILHSPLQLSLRLNSRTERNVLATFSLGYNCPSNVILKGMTLTILISSGMSSSRLSLATFSRVASAIAHTFSWYLSSRSRHWVNVWPCHGTSKLNNH